MSHDLPSVGDALAPLVKTVTQAGIDAYAAASGDYNPIHVDPQFAAQTAFKGTIAHGLTALGYIGQAMTRRFGRAWLESGRVEMKFRAPIRPGDTVTIGGRVVAHQAGGATLLEIVCENQQGTPVVTAQASVRLPIS